MVNSHKLHLTHCVPEYINYCLKSEVAIALCCQLINQYKSRCIWKANESYGKFSIMKRKPLHATTELILFTVSKDEWNTKEALVSPKSMHCMYCSMPKGTSWTKATSKSKNQACILSHCQVTLVLMHQAGRQVGKQAGRQAVENSIK